MTDYAADNISSPIASVVNERSGTASADTVPAGAYVLWRNTGAGAHTVTLTTNNTVAGGLTVQDLGISLAAGQVKGGRILQDWGDASGRVQVAIDGTAAEVKYYVIGP
jgi:hypothetical protein